MDYYLGVTTFDGSADAGLIARARAWAEGDPDPRTRAELERLVSDGALAELRERMAAELDFGTAGLRGPVGAGPARMNCAVVVRATRAFAEYLLAESASAGSGVVVVGHDARQSSRTLAEAAIGVLLAAGLNVRVFPGPAPTPLVAYAARALGTLGALVVTASHNPREDNGLKLYGPEAAQLVAPADAEVARRREALGAAATIPRLEPSAWNTGRARVEPVPPDLFDRYLDELVSALPNDVEGMGSENPQEDGRSGRPEDGRVERALSIVYSPIHGRGRAPLEQALRARGFTNFEVVAEQGEPDGTFPTAPSPNPELPQTLERVLALAEARRADLVLVNDPDVDRLAAAAPLTLEDYARSYRVLRGNEIAALLADFVLEHAPKPPRPLVISSIVSSGLVSRIAEHYGAESERTLTGFKWIWAAARALERDGGLHFVFGCEEALGFSVGDAVRDKDGISAALWLAELAARCLRDKKTLHDRLHELYGVYGAWGSAQRTLQGQGAEALAELRASVAQVVAAPPRELEGLTLSQVTDYRSGAEARSPWLGRAELYELHYGDSARVLIRPSGTEPKLKIYSDVNVAVAPSESAGRAAERARARAEALAASVQSSILKQRMP